MSGETRTSTLPASWFREPGMFDFERRAIASKSWLFVTHKNRFTKPGEYIRINISGYPVLIIRDRQGNINGFLNICRHRAFPLVHQDEGTANILACKYHGWSYGLNGKLAKAPRFENVPDFDKEEHGLFKVHTHIDRLGLIWINLDSSENPIPWEDQFGGLDTRQDMTKFSLENYVFEETWSMKGEFNWKTLVENYNECYHCTTAHPGVAAFITKETKFEINPAKNYIRHIGGGLCDDGKEDEMNAEPTYLFPFSTFNPTNIVTYTMLIEPISPTLCNMRYDFFRNPRVPVETYKETVDFFKQVEREDKWLGDTDQVNLNSGAYTCGPLHPYMEKAVTHFEKLLRRSLKEHADLEKKTGAEVWPVQRNYDSQQMREDEAFCKSICAGSGNQVPEFVW